MTCVWVTSLGLQVRGVFIVLSFTYSFLMHSKNLKRFHCRLFLVLHSFFNFPVFFMFNLFLFLGIKKSRRFQFGIINTLNILNYFNMCCGFAFFFVLLASISPTHYERCFFFLLLERAKPRLLTFKTITHPFAFISYKCIWISHENQYFFQFQKHVKELKKKKKKFKRIYRTNFFRYIFALKKKFTTRKTVFYWFFIFDFHIKIQFIANNFLFMPVVLILMSTE